MASEVKDARGFLGAVTRGRESLGLRQPTSTRSLAECLLRKTDSPTVLKGHRGCVNRLCWNEQGTLLASGSDDTRVILWSYPDWRRPAIVVPTNHKANIFGVKFLPLSGDAKLVTGAMDCEVQLHHLERVSREHNVHTTTLDFHHNRVKAVEVEQGNPHNFWSGSEDGNVLQFDCRSLREPVPLFQCRARYDRTLVEVKHLSINPVNPHLLALACGDPFVRVHDRRMASREPLLMLCPPHLALAAGSGSGRGSRAWRCGHHHTTCVSFGSTGRRLAASYHADHCYSFDLSGEGSVEAAFEEGSGPRRPWAVAGEDEAFAKVELGGRRGGGSASEDITAASRGLDLYPGSPSILLARADALLRRGWKADNAYALRDVERVLRSEEQGCCADGRPSVAVLSRLAQCLHDLAQDECASLVLKNMVGDRECGEDDVERVECLREAVAGELKRRGELEAQEDPEAPEDPQEEGDDEEILAAIRGGAVSTGLWRRREVNRLSQRYVGHANNQTDCKEVSFVGGDDSIVASGSDDGVVYMWDSNTGELVHILEADIDIVNCVQCHPSVPCLATSGLEHVVRIWEPKDTDLVGWQKAGMIDVIERNQEQNNETPVRPLAGEALDARGMNYGVLFRALANTYASMQRNEDVDAQCATQ